MQQDGGVFSIALSIWGNGGNRPKVRGESDRIFPCVPVFRSGEMKVLTEYLKFHTKTHRAYVHLTPQVEEIVRKSGVKEGMVLVSAMHITAGVYVNDNESGLIEDIDQWLEHLAPFRKNYKHHETGEDNGDSHLKALLIHHEVIVPITAGKLDLGTWQRIFYAEFDGQRDKRVIVKVMGE
jgi:secondary thiamine-phosphate synthase enzyme